VLLKYEREIIIIQKYVRRFLIIKRITHGFNFCEYTNLHLFLNKNELL
jgi:hypothetical protein